MFILWRKCSGRTANWKGGRLRGSFYCCRGSRVETLLAAAAGFRPAGQPRAAVLGGLGGPMRPPLRGLLFFAPFCSRLRLFLAGVVLQVGGQFLLAAIVADCGTDCHL